MQTNPILRALQADTHPLGNDSLYERSQSYLAQEYYPHWIIASTNLVYSGMFTILVTRDK